VIYTCKICNTELELSSCKKFLSKCFLSGSELERYQCTKCDTIFGTLEMLGITEDEMASEYSALDLVWKEGDTRASTTRTFFSLEPIKSGTYLDFGCGSKHSAIRDLRNQGWDVFGYEPFVSGCSRDFLIDTKFELSALKFDGVFSNNVLEHLQDPVQDLLFMKSLLKNDSCKMSHSTSCYEYLYEYSKYHLYFFVGSSTEYLCHGAGLSLVSRTRDGEYINQVYSQVTP
jgi:hypothetical protein